jgi:hypothetical protein
MLMELLLWLAPMIHKELFLVDRKEKLGSGKLANNLNPWKNR